MFARSTRTRKLWRAVLALSIGFALVLVLLELGIRFLVLGDSELARRLGADLRQAENFADGNVDDDYWKLQYLFLPEANKGPARNEDPSCGWTGDYVRPGTYEHARAAEVRGRRPVLLYGDSYAACATGAEACFEGILDRSDLAETHGLVNYGVGGYGLDQICLLIRNTIDAWQGRDPIVVVSFLVDNDFDRDVLSFRCWPKPRFSLEDGRLVASGPVVTDPERFLEENPPSIRSYLLRLLTYRQGMLPPRLQWYLRRGSLKNEEKIALGRRILEEIHRELESRGIEHFFLAFHGEASVAGSDGTRWADELARNAARDLGVPLVETRPYLLAAAQGSVEEARRYFGGGPRLVGHYNEMGNIIVFEALRAGIERRFGEVDPRAIEAAIARNPLFEAPGDVVATILGRPARIRTRGSGGLVRMSKFPYPPFHPSSKTPYLLLRPGEEGATELTIDVEGENRSFRGRASGVTRGAEEDLLFMTVRLDGKELVRARVPYYEGRLDLDIPLEGVKRLEIVVESPEPRAGKPWVHIAGARLE